MYVYEPEPSEAEVVFWRAFFINAGPALGFTEEQVEALDDAEVVEAGDQMVEGVAFMFETFGKLVGRGVKTYRATV